MTCHWKSAWNHVLHNPWHVHVMFMSWQWRCCCCLHLSDVDGGERASPGTSFSVPGHTPVIFRSAVHALFIRVEVCVQGEKRYGVCVWVWVSEWVCVWCVWASEWVSVCVCVVCVSEWVSVCVSVCVVCVCVCVYLCTYLSVWFHVCPNSHIFFNVQAYVFVLLSRGLAACF